MTATPSARVARNDRLDEARAERRSTVRAAIWPRTSTIPARIERLFASADIEDAVTAGEFGRDLDATFDAIDARDRSLLDRAHAGDESATIALYTRYLNLIESTANLFGRMAERNDKPAVFDADDAHQEAAVVLMEIIRDGANGKPFAARFKSEVRSIVGEEAYRFLRTLPVSRDAVRMVMDAVELFEGDLDAASAYLEKAPAVRHRVSRDRFFAVLLSVDPERVVQLDASIGEDETPVADLIEDPFAAAAFDGVLGHDQFASLTLIAEWANLSERQRRTVAMLIGLYDEPMTQDAVAAELGVSQQAVSKIYKTALANLRSALDAPIPAPEPRPTRRARIRPAAESGVPVSPGRPTIRSFPVPNHEATTGVLKDNGAWPVASQRPYGPPRITVEEIMRDRAARRR